MFKFGKFWFSSKLAPAVVEGWGVHVYRLGDRCLVVPDGRVVGAPSGVSVMLTPRGPFDVHDAALHAEVVEALGASKEAFANPLAEGDVDLSRDPVPGAFGVTSHRAMREGGAWGVTVDGPSRRGAQISWNEPRGRGWEGRVAAYLDAPWGQVAARVVEMIRSDGP